MSKKGGPSIQNMHIAFGAACLVLLVATVYAFYQDYEREYTPWQQDYYSKELTRLTGERKVAEEDLTQADYKEELDKVQQKIKDGEKEFADKKTAVDNARADMRKIDDKLQLEKRNLNFTKSDLMTLKYKIDQKQARMEDLEAMQKKTTDKATEVYDLQAKRDAAQAVIAGAEADLKSSTKERDVLKSAETDLNAKIKKAVGSPLINIAKDFPGINFIGPRYHIEQVVLPNLPEERFFVKTQRVDRCVSCHKAIDNLDASYTEHDPKKLEPVLRSHPRLDLFVSANSKHPYKQFGCTICHQGKPMGTTFSRAAHSPQNEAQAKEWEKKYDWEFLHYWDNKMLPLQHTEAACLKCHRGLDDVPEANKLNEGRYLFRDRGCTNCHMGLSGDKDMAWVGRIGPDLRRIGEKTNLNWARNWIANPWSFRPSTKMPRFFGLENRTDKDNDLSVNGEHMPRDPVEIEAIATYLFTASKLREVAPPAPPPGDAKAGEELFEGIGCLGCHSTLDAKEKDEKYDYNRHGPDLSRVGDKLTPGWLYAWLKQPRNYWAETKMPNLRLSDKEAADLTAFLMTTMKIKDVPPVKDNDDTAFDQIIRDKLGATIPIPTLNTLLEDPTKMMEDSLKNKVKFVTAKDGKRVDTGDGEWTVAQIEKLKEIIGSTKDPKRAAKAFYTGETLIQHHGCYGCHNIQGWTFAPLTCVSLAGEADKDLEKLDFGKTLAENAIGHTKWDWFYTKIARPRVYDIGKLDLILPFDRLRMPWFGYNPQGGKGGGEGGDATEKKDEKHASLHPDSNPDLAENSTPYGLTPHQIERLVTHVLSLTMEQIPTEMQHAPAPQEIAIDRGHRVIRELNCTGCHIIGVGGDIEHGGEAYPSSIPAEALVALLPQAGTKAMQELRKPGNGIYLDEDVADLDYEAKEADSPSSLQHFVAALRGAYVTDITAPIILGEKKLRANIADPLTSLGFHFEDKAIKKDEWVPYGQVITPERFLEVTKYLYGSEKDAQDAYKKLSKKYVEKVAYERLAGTQALATAPEEQRLTALQIEDRKVTKEFYEPFMIKVRFQRGEGRVVPAIIAFEKEKGVDPATQQQAPPSLSYEGGKVQPDWLYQFLHNVYPLRQGLDVRIPSFWTHGQFSKYKSIYPAGHLSAIDPLKRNTGVDGEPLPSAEAPTVAQLPDDAAQVDEFFVADAGVKTFGSQPIPLATDNERKVYKDGEHLIFAEEKVGGMACIQCHAVGNLVPKETKWAPNLINVKRRLRADWVQRFLIYPASIYPWTNMPNNFHFDWDNYKYSATDPYRGIQGSSEDNVKTWAEKLHAAEYYLMHSGDAEVGESK